MRIANFIVLSKVAATIALARMPAKSNDFNRANDLSALPPTGPDQRSGTRSLRIAETTTEKAKEERTPSIPRLSHIDLSSKSASMAVLNNAKYMSRMNAMMNHRDPGFKPKDETDEAIRLMYQQLVDTWILKSKKYRLENNSDRTVHRNMQTEWGYSDELKTLLIMFMKKRNRERIRELEAKAHKQNDFGLSFFESLQALKSEYGDLPRGFHGDLAMANKSWRPNDFEIDDLSKRWLEVGKHPDDAKKALVERNLPKTFVDRVITLYAIKYDKKIDSLFKTWLAEYLHPFSIAAKWEAVFGTPDNFTIKCFQEYLDRYEKARAELEKNLEKWFELDIDPDRVLSYLDMEKLSKAQRKSHPNNELYLKYEQRWENKKQIEKLKMWFENHITEPETVKGLSTNKHKLIRKSEADLEQKLEACVKLSIDPDSIFEWLKLRDLDKARLENQPKYKVYFKYKQRWEREKQVQLQFNKWLDRWVDPSSAATEWEAVFGALDDSSSKYLKEYKERYEKTRAELEKTLETYFELDEDFDSVIDLLKLRGLDEASLKKHPNYNLYLYLKQRWGEKNMA